MINPNLPFAPLRIVACGSRVTCNPPPEGTDRDWLLLIEPQSTPLVALALESANWELGGSEIPDADNTLPPDARFLSFVFGEDNLILTESPVFFQRFVAATSVAKRLNLLDKSDRIALFQAVLYGKDCETELFA